MKFYASDNGIKIPLQRKLGVSRGEQEMYRTLSTLSLQMRGQNYCLNKDKDIVKVDAVAGTVNPVSDEELVELVSKVIPTFNIFRNNIGNWERDCIKSELFLIEDLDLITKTIPNRPIINIGKIKEKVSQHNKDLDFIPVRNSYDASINYLIDFCFFISNGKLYRFDTYGIGLGCYGDYGGRVSFSFNYSMANRVHISFDGKNYTALIEQNLMEVSEDKVLKVYDELKRQEDIENKKKLLQVFS